MATTGISTHAATRRTARDTLRAQRHAGRQLPATWLGTGGKPDPADEGWQGHMWWHPAYAVGGTYLAGTGVDHLLRAGLVDPVGPISPGVAAAALGVAGGAAGIAAAKRLTGWARTALTLGPVAGGAATGAALAHQLGPIQPGAVVATAAAGLGLAAGAAGLLNTAGERFSGWARAFCTFGPIAAGAWLAGVAATSPYNVPMLATAAAGATATMLSYRRMRDEQDRHELAWASRFAIPTPGPTGEPQRPPAPPVETADPDCVPWTAAFQEVGLKGCIARRKVDTPAGYAVLVIFPRSGNIGMTQVATKLESIERALGMLKDCLEVDSAIHPANGRELADRCWIHVDVADILSQLLPMPEDHEPTTINEAFRIGTYMDGRPMALKLREISALIIGVRGRGKTNLFHVIVHALSRCVDVVLWAIDLKGGRAVKPWLAPWLSGKPGPDGKTPAAPRPVFDWVATTRLEAALMIHAANALIAHRGNASHGGSKLEPSEANPAVLVLCDEVAALVGRHSGPTTSRDWRNPTAGQMSKALTLGVQLGRSEAVDYVLFSQRGTVTMTGGGDLKSQCEMRLGLGVTNPGDASAVFQNDNVNARKLNKLKHKRTRGAALVENGDDPNHLCGKTYYYGDGMDMVARIERAATAHAMYPADLPLLEQQAIDDALRLFTGPRDKNGNITGPGEYGYGIGPDGARAERWSLARAEHLYTDGLPDDWTDDEPSDGEHLGGTSGPAAPAPPRGGGVATTTRPAAPAAPATAPVPTQRGHLHAVPDSAPPPDGDQAAGRDGSRYYTRRRDRDAGDQAQAEAAAADALFAGLDKGFEKWLEDLPETSEPAQLADDSAEELSRYDLMVETIRKAGTAGTTPGRVYAEMGDRAWSARTDIYPPLRKALAERVIVQPAGKGGRYYHRDHAPTRPAQ